MATLVFNTGFEHGTVQAVGSTSAGIATGAGNLIGSTTGSASFDASAARSGSYGLLAPPSSYVTTVSTLGSSLVVRFYFRIDQAPSIAGRILRITSNLDVYITTSRFVEVRNAVGAVEFTGTNALTVNTWYRLDVKSDSATDVWSVQVTDASGTVMESVTDDAYGTAVGNAGSLLIGNIDAATMTVHVDDVAVSATMADFPLGAGYGGALLPASLTLASSGVFVQNATATAIGTGDSTLIDDVPMDETTSFIRQTTGSSTQPGGSTKVNFVNASADTIQGVRAMVAYGAASTASNAWRMWVAANGVDTYLHGSSSTQPAIAAVGPVYAAVMVANGGVAWTDAMLDALQIFFGTGGGTDVNPVPRFNNALLEVDYAEAVAARPPLPRVSLQAVQRSAVF